MKLTIRKVGNSAGIIFPAALLRSLRLSIGSIVTVELLPEKLVLSPKKPRYTLSELLAQCDPNAPPPQDFDFT